jgi:Ca2+-binding EF-hand superfamily protein
MNKLRIAIVTSSLLTLCSAGVALADSSGAKKEARRPPIAEAMAASFFERVDANKDGQVARAEAEGAGQQFFDRFDLNKDNEVTAREADDGARVMREEELDARFKALDKNGDGRLTLEEAKVPAMFFERLDTNQDKVATREEFRAVAKLNGGGGDLGFKRVDRNGDGKVTRAEATEAVLLRFASADPNGDGIITRAELDAHIEQKTKRGGKGQPAGKSGGKS